jgi:AcrR family transcriptional regulator
MAETPTTEKSGRSNGLAAERRAQIFEAATRVFARKGFHKATVQEIADEAGMGKGTIYEYIKSKKDILFFAISEVHARLFTEVEKLVKLNIKPETKLRRAIRIQLELIDQYHEATRTVIPEVEGMAQIDHERIESLKRLYIGSFEPIYKQGVDQGAFKDVDAFLVMEIICDACVLWGKSDTIRERCPDVKSYENFLVNMYLNGFLK